MVVLTFQFSLPLIYPTSATIPLSCLISSSKLNPSNEIAKKKADNDYSRRKRTRTWQLKETVTDTKEAIFNGRSILEVACLMKFILDRWFVILWFFFFSHANLISLCLLLSLSFPDLIFIYSLSLYLSFYPSLYLFFLKINENPELLPNLLL